MAESFPFGAQGPYLALELEPLPDKPGYALQYFRQVSAALPLDDHRHGKELKIRHVDTLCQVL